MPDVTDGTVSDNTGMLTSLQLDPYQTNPTLIRGSTCLEYPCLQIELSPRAVYPHVRAEFPSHLFECPSGVP